MSKFEVIQGVEGCCIGLDGTRIAGPKPWGGGTVIHSWETDKEYAEVSTCECDYTIRWEWEWTDQTAYFEHGLSCGHVITSTEEEPPNHCEECGAKIRKAVCGAMKRELETLTHELRTYAGVDGDWVAGPIRADMLREAADTIESLRRQVAKCQIAELKADYDTSRHFELFGTPERAARTLLESTSECRCCVIRKECGYDLDACVMYDHDKLLEWLRGDA